MILDEKEVEKLFETCDHQMDVVIGIYKMVYPNWDDIESIDGFPTINRTTNEKFFKLFTKFDRKNHPNVIPGGIWMNHGFSEEDGLDDWEVVPCGCILKD